MIYIVKSLKTENLPDSRADPLGPPPPAVDLSLEILTKRLVRAHHAGEQRLAATRRQFFRVQHGGERRPRVVREIRVPVLASVDGADGFIVFPDIGDDEHFWHAGQGALR